MKATLKLPVKQTVLLFLVTLSGYLLADSNRLSKIRPRTVVYLYNMTDKPLKSTFTFKALDGKSVDNAAHYPNIDDTINAIPVDMQNGMTVIAELARNRGIERGREYIFTETLDLPGLGPILELKQYVVGNPRSLLNPLAFGSTIKAGFAVPSRGIEPQYFDDQEWHRLIIPELNGDWVVDFCFYGSKIWSDVKLQLEEKNKSALVATGAIMAGAFATAVVAAAARSPEITPGMSREKYAKKLAENPSIIDQIASGVFMATPVAIWLSTKVTSIRDNLLYKIEFIPKQQLSE